MAKLLTKRLEAKFEKQGDTSHLHANEIKIVCKFYLVMNPEFCWYLYDRVDDDTFMAFVNLNDPMMAECGHISIGELESLEQEIRIDYEYEPQTLEEVINQTKDY